MLGTFISYRRDDTAGYAGRLRESLDRSLGRASVFRDLDGLRPGDDFVRKIDERLASCRVMLVLIGRNWVDARDQAGARRLEDPLDFVRLEVSKALAGSDVVVVPVLLDGASMPSGRQLPDDLQLLTRRQAITLRDETWDADINRLVGPVRARHPRDRGQGPTAALRELDVGTPRRDTDSPQLSFDPKPHRRACRGGLTCCSNRASTSIPPLHLISLESFVCLPARLLR